MDSHNRPMTSSQKICLWGKYAVALVVVVMISLLFVDMSPASSDPVSPTLPNPLPPAKQVDSSENSIQSHFHSINCSYLGTLRDTISRVRSEIAHEWNITHYPNFLSMMHIPQRSWDIQKAKFIKLIINREENNNTVQASSKKKSFVAGFSGSSVTAGHG